MPIEIRAAALCVFWQADCFLVAEIVDPLTGARLHRPPGGGIEEGESPEQAVVREVREELSIALAGVRCLGAIDHVWHWNGREVHERAWIFVPDPPVMNKLADTASSRPKSSRPMAPVTEPCGVRSIPPAPGRRYARPAWNIRCARPSTLSPSQRRHQLIGRAPTRFEPPAILLLPWAQAYAQSPDSASSLFSGFPGSSSPAPTPAP